MTLTVWLLSLSHDPDCLAIIRAELSTFLVNFNIHMGKMHSIAMGGWELVKSSSGGMVNFNIHKVMGKMHSVDGGWEHSTPRASTYCFGCTT